MPTMAETHARCSSITREMRTSCFIMYFSRAPMIRTRWLRRQAPIYRSAFGICTSNRSSALPGSNTSCARQTRLTFMVILASDSMKRPRSADASAIVQQWAKFLIFSLSEIIRDLKTER